MYVAVRKNKDGSVNILDTDDFVIDTFTMEELAPYLDSGVEVIGARRNMFMNNQIVITIKKLYCLYGFNSYNITLSSLDGTEKQEIKLKPSKSNVKTPLSETDADLIESIIEDNRLINMWNRDYNFTKDLFFHSRKWDIEKYERSTVSINRRRYEMYRITEYDLSKAYKKLLSKCDIYKLCKEDLDYSRYYVLERDSSYFSATIYDKVEDEILSFDYRVIKDEMIKGYGFNGVAFDELGTLKYTRFYDKEVRKIKQGNKVSAENENRRILNIINSSEIKCLSNTKYTYKGIYRDRYFNYYDNRQGVGYQLQLEDLVSKDNFITLENFGNKCDKIISDLEKAKIKIEARGKLTGMITSKELRDIDVILSNIKSDNAFIFNYDSEQIQKVFFERWLYKNHLSMTVRFNGEQMYATEYTNMLENDQVVMKLLSDNIIFNISLSQDNLDWVTEKNNNYYLGLIQPSEAFGVYSEDNTDTRGLPFKFGRRISTTYLEYSKMRIGKKYKLPVPLGDAENEHPLEYFTELAKFIDGDGILPLMIVGVEVKGFNVRYIQLCVEMNVSWLDVGVSGKAPFINDCSIFINYLDKSTVQIVPMIKDGRNYIMAEVGYSTLIVPEVIWEV